jgi:tyrosine-specific transport protein
MVACFITGNLIGAGILGLPIKTGVAGFLPSLAGTFMISCAMFLTAMVLARESVSTHQEVFHYPSMYRQYFGPFGKWAATAANLVILYGSLLVYITGATAIIIDFSHTGIPRELIILLFFIPVTAVTIINPKSLLKFNTFFVILLLVSFAGLVAMGERYVEAQRLERVDWAMLPAALPIIVMAANFHSIIPTVCKQLKWNFRDITIAIFAGTLIGFIMNSIWIHTGIGVLPLSGQGGIVHALDNNLPATVPLAEAIKTHLFTPVSIVFAIVAIVTSYISFGNTTMDFIDDIMTNHIKVKNRLLTVGLAFFPPLIIAIVYPDIFLNALDFVGGIGVVILFGIFPCVIALKRKGHLFRKVLLFAPVLVLFIAILLFKGLQESGNSGLNPKVEYWTNFRFFSHHSPK